MVAKRYEIEVDGEIDALIRARVDSGEYDSPDQVVQAALRLMECLPREYAVSRDRLRAKIASGLAQIENGQVVDGPAAMERIKQKLLKRAADDGITE